MKPSAAPAPLQQALQHHQAGRWEEADRAYRLVRTQQPRCFEAWHNAGLLALQRDRPAEALPLLTQALQLQPRSAEVQFHLGLALRALGRMPDAVRCLKLALQLRPTWSDACHQLGVTLQHAGQLADAAKHYQKALELNPKQADSLEALGALVADTQGLGLALPYFQTATQLNPDRASAWCNLGLSLIHLRRYDEALDALGRARALDPRLLKAHTGRALALQSLYRLQEAADAFAEAARLSPSDSEAWSGRLLSIHYLDTFSPETVAAEHLAFGQAVAALEKPGAFGPRDPSRPLKVGFLSPDFRRHAVASFFLPLLRHLDRTRFEIVLYHDHAVNDAVTDSFRGLCDHWRNLAGKVHGVVEKQIRDDRLDLLVDLCGHTGVNRMDLLARRLAPVQITYLGYPNTTGLRSMDFRFTDERADPPGTTESWHSEQLVRFSPCAWAFEPEPQAPDSSPLLETATPLRLGCFNNYAKVSDRTLRLWSRVLAALPEARLCLKAQDLDRDAFQDGVRVRLAGFGIAPERVDFLGRTAGTVEHLAAYRGIDISLDPFPYHGTTSTCEALWMGVPVISLAGVAHVSRVGASLLAAIGHPEWSVNSEEEYVGRVVELADGRTRNPVFRESIREAMRSSVLLDHAGQAARFATALETCAAARRS